MANKILKKSEDNFGTFSIFRKVFVVGPDIHAHGGMAEVLRLYRDNIFPQSSFIYFPSNSRKGFFAGVLKLLNLLRKITLYRKQCGILHLHVTCGKSFYRKLFIALWGKRLGYKIITHWHGGKAPVFFHSRFRINALKRLGKLSDGWIALTPDWKSFFSLYLEPELITVIGNPVKIYPHSTTKERKDINFLYLGGASEDKGIYELLEAFCSLPYLNIPMSLTLAGDGDYSRLAGRISRIPDYIRVNVIGWVDDKEKEKLFKVADVFVQPSHYECQSMCTLEAKAHGIPVIETDRGCLCHSRPHKFNAASSINHIIGEILRLSSDDTIRITEGERNLMEVTNNLPEVVQQDLLNVYVSILPA